MLSGEETISQEDIFSFLLIYSIHTHTKTLRGRGIEKERDAMLVGFPEG